MKRMIAAVLTLLLAVALCACGGEKIPDSPYLGTWTAVSAQFGDADVPIDEVFPGGMVLELQASGVCQLTLGDQSDPASWSAADGNITISDGETDRRRGRHRPGDQRDVHHPDPGSGRERRRDRGSSRGS